MPIAFAILALSSSSIGRAPAVCEQVCSTYRERVAKCYRNQRLFYDQRTNTLCLNGLIDTNGKLESDLKQLRLMRGVLLVPTSDGGGLASAIRISRFLRRYSYSVAVSGMCASACAQFLFIGAKKRIILDDGVVAMHGGPIADDAIDQMDVASSVKVSLKAEQKQFQDFYFEKRVSIALTTDAPPKVLSALSSGQVTFWMPSAAQFKKYGVRLINCNAKFLF